MNKNILIGLLAVLVLVGGGYLLLNNKSTTSNVNLYNQNPTSQNPTNTEVPVKDTTPPLTLSTPTVTTSPDSSVTTSTAVVSGQVTPNGIYTTYWFEYGENSTMTNRTVSQDIGSGFYNISSPAFITNLKANTVYSYRLMASNNLGAAYGATYSFKTNNDPPIKAATPSISSKSASNISNVGVTLNGQVNPNGWQLNYWFEYGKTSKFGNATSIRSMTDSATFKSITQVSEPLTGLEPLTKYYFRLNAQNQFGTINGATLSFTTKGPASTK